MELFEFIIILVVITTLGKVLMAVGVPLVEKLGDLVREMAASRRGGEAVEGGIDPVLLEDLEDRLARIEDRLDFLEELRAPERRPALGGGRPGDRPGSAE